MPPHINTCKTVLTCIINLFNFPWHLNSTYPRISSVIKCGEICLQKCCWELPPGTVMDHWFPNTGASYSLYPCIISHMQICDFSCKKNWCKETDIDVQENITLLFHWKFHAILNAKLSLASHKGECSAPWPCRNMPINMDSNCYYSCSCFNWNTENI